MNNTGLAKAKYTYKINGKVQQGDVEYSKKLLGYGLKNEVLKDLSNNILEGDYPAVIDKVNDRMNYKYLARRLLEEGVDDHIICTFENDKTENISLSEF